MRGITITLTFIFTWHKLLMFAFALVLVSPVKTKLQPKLLSIVALPQPFLFLKLSSFLRFCLIIHLDKQ